MRGVVHFSNWKKKTLIVQKEVDRKMVAVSLEAVKKIITENNFILNAFNGYIGFLQTNNLLISKNNTWRKDPHFLLELSARIKWAHSFQPEIDEISKRFTIDVWYVGASSKLISNIIKMCTEIIMELELRPLQEMFLDTESEEVVM